MAEHARGVERKKGSNKIRSDVNPSLDSDSCPVWSLDVRIGEQDDTKVKATEERNVGCSIAG
jgi:hypothetical protein